MEFSNFEFIKSKWNQLFQYAQRAETYACDDPCAALFYLRKFAERFVAFVYKWKNKPAPNRPELKEMINGVEKLLALELKQQDAVNRIIGGLQRIQEDGNRAVHGTHDDLRASQDRLIDAWEIAKWLKVECDNGQVEQFAPFTAPQPSLTDWIRSFDELFPNQSRFFGRQGILSAIDSAIERNQKGIILIEGEPGRGKSTLIREFVRRRMDSEDCLLVEFFFRANHGVNDPNAFTRHLFATLISTLKLSIKSLDYRKLNMTELHQSLNRLFETQIAERLRETSKSLYIVIDALDEAGLTNDGKSIFDRLPSVVPNGTFILMTARPNTFPEISTLRDDFVRPSCNMEDVKWQSELTTDTRDFVTNETQGLKLSEEIRREIVRVGAGNFLVIEQLCRSINDGMPGSDLRELLRRMAAEPASHLRVLYDASWNRARGLLSKEERDMFERVAGVIATSHVSRLPATTVAKVAGITYPQHWNEMCAGGRLGQFLDIRQDSESGPTVGFYHLSFQEFVLALIRENRTKIEALWSDFCGQHSKYQEGSTELAYSIAYLIPHVLASTGSHGAIDWITKWEFLIAKLKHSGMIGILRDYDDVRQSLPNEDCRNTCQEWSDRLLEYCGRWTARVAESLANDTILNETGLPQVVPNRPDVTDTLELMTLAEQRLTPDRIAPSPWLQRFTEFERFWRAHSNLIQRVPESLLALAANNIESELIAKEARTQLSKTKTPWLKWLNPPEKVVGKPFILSKMQFGSNEGDSPDRMRFSADGKRLVAFNRMRIEVWNLATATREHELENVHACDVSADGRKAIGFSEQTGLLVWDLESEQLSQVLKEPRYEETWDSPATSLKAREEENRVYTQAQMTPDGRLAVSLDRQGNLDLWDLSTGCLLRQQFVAPDELSWIILKQISPQGRWIRIGIHPSEDKGSVEHRDLVWHFFNNTLSEAPKSDFPSDEMLAHSLHVQWTNYIFTPDCELVMTTLEVEDQAVCVYVHKLHENKATPQVIRRIDITKILVGCHISDSDEYSISTSDDGKLLAVAAGRVILLADLASGILNAPQLPDVNNTVHSSPIELPIVADQQIHRSLRRENITQNGRLCLTTTESPSIQVTNTETPDEAMLEIFLDRELNHLMLYVESLTGLSWTSPSEFWNKNPRRALGYLFPSGTRLAVVLEVQLRRGRGYQIHLIYDLVVNRITRMYCTDFDLSNESLLAFYQFLSRNDTCQDNQPEDVFDDGIFHFRDGHRDDFVLSSDERLWLHPAVNGGAGYCIISHQPIERNGQELTPVPYALPGGNWRWSKDNCLTWVPVDDEFDSSNNVECRRLESTDTIRHYRNIFPVGGNFKNAIDTSRDGSSFIVSSLDGTMTLWNVFSTECLLAYPFDYAPAKVEFKVSGELILSFSISFFDSYHDVSFELKREYRVENPSIPNLPLVTPTRLYLFDKLTAHTAIRTTANAPAGLSGRFDDRITAVCPYCDHQFEVPPKFLATIKKINEDLAPGESPSLKLPLNSWNNHGLIDQCPEKKCGQKIRYNPFIVDSSNSVG